MAMVKKKTSGNAASNGGNDGNGDSEQPKGVAAAIEEYKLLVSDLTGPAIKDFPKRQRWQLPTEPDFIATPPRED